MTKEIKTDVGINKLSRRQKTRLFIEDMKAYKANQADLKRQHHIPDSPPPSWIPKFVSISPIKINHQGLTYYDLFCEDD